MKLRFCVICGTNKNLEHHHIIPRVMGGGDHQHNFLTLCHDHHDWIHNIRRTKLDSESFSNLVKEGHYRRRKETGWNGGRPRLEKEKIDEILDLRDKGYSLRYIKKQTGSGLATIQKYCSEINDQINENSGGV